MNAAPFACFATRPTSTVRVRPASSMEKLLNMASSPFHSFATEEAEMDLSVNRPGPAGHPSETTKLDTSYNPWALHAPALQQDFSDVSHAHFSGLGRFFCQYFVYLDNTKVEYTKNMRSTHKFAITF